MHLPIFESPCLSSLAQQYRTIAKSILALMPRRKMKELLVD
jgi:hypothetical protein